MSRAILIDSRENARGLERFLKQRSDQAGAIRVLEKEDALADREFCASLRYLFSCWNMPVFSEEEVADLFPTLEAIFYAAGDARYFAAPFERRSIPIFIARDQNAIPVAEFVVAQILLANKGYFQAERRYRRGFWRLAFRSARGLSLGMAGNHHSVVGLIGFGAIGSRVAKLLQAFDLEVRVHDPFIPVADIRAAGAHPAGLADLFRSCDVVSNHLPDVEDTRGLLGYELFSSMKPGATFINTGRGRQVDEAALVRAMREAPSRSALLDVTRREPPLPLSALFRSPNIFLSPHIAGSQGAEVHRLYEAVYRDYLDVAGGRPVQSPRSGGGG